MQRHHVPLGHPRLGQPGGHPADGGGEFGVAQGLAGHAVDQGGGVAVAGGAGQHHVVERLVDDGDVGVLAAERHGDSCGSATHGRVEAVPEVLPGCRGAHAPA